MNSKKKIYLQNTKELTKVFPQIKPIFLEDLLNNFPIKYLKKNVNVIFVTQAYIKELNEDYRKKDYITDVLSFNIDSDTLLGEIYLCPLYVKDNIEKDKHLEEVLRLITHGILHLNNFDHATEFSEQKYDHEEMYVIQEKILSNLLKKSL